MLKRILLFIKNNGEFSDKVIAKNLNIAESMVSEVKEQLIRMGYLEKVIEEKCTCTCTSCPQSCSSKKLNDISEWKITDKGLKAIS